MPPQKFSPKKTGCPSPPRESVSPENPFKVQIFAIATGDALITQTSFSTALSPAR